MTRRALIARLAAFLILISQLIAVWLAFVPTGESAIVFSFVGTPALGAGVALGILALALRRAGEE